jgi:hypothetical protein
MTNINPEITVGGNTQDHYKKKRNQLIFVGFFGARVSQTICPGWLQTVIFLTAAS